MSDDIQGKREEEDILTSVILLTLNANYLCLVEFQSQGGGWPTCHRGALSHYPGEQKGKLTMNHIQWNSQEREGCLTSVGPSV